MLRIFGVPTEKKALTLGLRHLPVFVRIELVVQMLVDDLEHRLFGQLSVDADQRNVPKFFGHFFFALEQLLVQLMEKGEVVLAYKTAEWRTKKVRI